MKRVFLSLFALTACTTANVEDIPVVKNDNSSSTAQQAAKDDTIHQLPQELSIPYFKDMKLEGKDLELTKVLANNSAYTRYEIRYNSNGLTISGIMNIPKGVGPYPLVIFNHGYIAPSVYTIGRGLKREQDYLARQGFAVLHTDYRGHGASDPSPDTKEIYDASLEYTMDSINAIKAVRNSTLPELSRIDATRVGMLGHSLGGGVTLNTLVAHPEMIDAAVLYAPVSGDAYKNFDRWRRERPEGDNTLSAFGEQGTEQPWQELSALNYLNNIDDPVLLFHGTSDDDVPIEWSQELNEEMNKEGKLLKYIVYQNEEHEFIPKFDDFMRQTAEFLRLYLIDENTNRHQGSSLMNKDRITKKPFGKYVTPDNSPVQPEKFTGYHVGADFELVEGEDPHRMNVTAICDGPIVFRDWVNGYGGVLVQACEHNENPVTIIYGHIWLDSTTVYEGDKVSTGEVIANLGKGYSQETDGERAHLHLGVSRGAALDLKGYTSSAESAYSGWIDPRELF